jgi:hypothetical protein
VALTKADKLEFEKKPVSPKANDDDVVIQDKEILNTPKFN